MDALLFGLVKTTVCVIWFCLGSFHVYPDGFQMEHPLILLSFSCIDDIVLGYIVSVLEQLGEDEQFDEEEFAEIMDAYIPGFDTINTLFSWR